MLLFVATLDGKVTKWGASRVSLWSSHQDQFTNESAGELTARFHKSGHKQMLVVGGPHVANSFFRETIN